MTDEFKQMVIDTLRRGDELPREWARELFPAEKREYELVYQGKEREEDIIADTMASTRIEEQLTSLDDNLKKNAVHNYTKS